MQEHSTLPAAHGGGYTPAKFDFADPELLGQPHADFQENDD